MLRLKKEKKQIFLVLESELHFWCNGEAPGGQGHIWSEEKSKRSKKIKSAVPLQGHSLEKPTS